MVSTNTARLMAVSVGLSVITLVVVQSGDTSLTGLPVLRRTLEEIKFTYAGGTDDGYDKEAYKEYNPDEDTGADDGYNKEAYKEYNPDEDTEATAAIVPGQDLIERYQDDNVGIPADEYLASDVPSFGENGMMAMGKFDEDGNEIFDPIVDPMDSILAEESREDPAFDAKYTNPLAETAAQTAAIEAQLANAQEQVSQSALAATKAQAQADQAQADFDAAQLQAQVDFQNKQQEEAAIRAQTNADLANKQAQQDAQNAQKAADEATQNQVQVKEEIKAQYGELGYTALYGEDGYASEDVFSAAMLFTVPPTASYDTSEDTFTNNVYDVNTRVVEPTDYGWQSGVVDWYDSKSGNYGILWSSTGTTQIFSAGRDMDDMVEMGRDDELFTLGSMNAAEQDFIAAPGASEKKNSSSEDDNGTVIGLAIMGIAMLSLVVIAAVVLKRRSSRKNGGKNVSNLNSAFQDHEEFHDEPSKAPTMFTDDEPAGFASSSASEPEFLTVDGEAVEEGIAGLAATDLPLFPDNPELYRNAI